MYSFKRLTFIISALFLLSPNYTNLYSKQLQDNTFNSSTMKKYEQSFKEFAQNFIDIGTTSLSNFKTYSENKIEAIDFDKGDWTKVSISKTYNYLKYYFKFKKYKIKKSKIDFTDGEFTVTLYFRKNENGEWKLYKYDGVA